MEKVNEEKKHINEYIETTEDKSVLTETEEIILNHFRSKYPKFDLMIEKWMYQSLVDLYNEGSDFWCQNTHGHYNGDFYHEGFSMVNYGSHFIELYKEKFGFEDEIEICEEGYRGNISQIESDFVDDLYNYSKDVVFTVFEIRKKLGSSILSELLDELYTKRLFVVPVKELEKPVTYWGETESEGGNFSHPKLQKNWCYEYLHKVPLVDLPLTYNLKERIDNKTIYLDTKKVDFQNTTPVFQQITPS
jgi:hypothetical protein